jgi:hypothetical protein
MSVEKSAEGIVAPPARSEGPNSMNRKGIQSLDETWRRVQEG